MATNKTPIKFKDGQILKLQSKALNYDCQELNMNPGYCVGNCGYKKHTDKAAKFVNMKKGNTAILTDKGTTQPNTVFLY